MTALGCSSMKRAYRSGRDAKEGLRWLKEHGKAGRNAKPYRCAECATWHIASDQLRRRRRKGMETR